MPLGLLLIYGLRLLLSKRASLGYKPGRRAGTMIVRAFLAVFAVLYVHVYLRALYFIRPPPKERT